MEFPGYHPPSPQPHREPGPSFPPHIPGQDRITAASDVIATIQQHYFLLSLVFLCLQQSHQKLQLSYLDLEYVVGKMDPVPCGVVEKEDGTLKQCMKFYYLRWFYFIFYLFNLIFLRW
jgi:hypothetical protein